MDFQFMKLLTDTLVNVRFMCRGLFLERQFDPNMSLYVFTISNIRLGGGDYICCFVLVEFLFLYIFFQHIGLTFFFSLTPCRTFKNY